MGAAREGKATTLLRLQLYLLSYPFLPHTPLALNPTSFHALSDVRGISTFLAL